MKKKLSALFLLLVLCIGMAVPAFAAQLPRLVDEAGLLSAQEAESLNAYLDEISERLGFDVVIATVNSLSGMDPERAAEVIYDEGGYGFGTEHDGVLLLVNMGERDWVITSTGWGRQAINEDARARLSDAFLGDLSAGNYNAAFSTFAGGVNGLVSQAQNGSYYRTPFPAARAIVVALIVGVLVALIVISSMKRKLKSVAFRSEAADYIRSGSLELTQSGERFLYHNVVRTPKPQNDSASRGGSSNHSSSSGKF